MPRTRSQNEQIRTVRRAQILAAAVPLFAHHGFSATNVAAVARAAGIAHGTVFLYFATKEDLFRAALLEPLAEFERETVLARPAHSTPSEYLRQLTGAHMAVFSRRRSFLRLTQYVLGQRDRFPELATALFGFATRFCDRLVPVIREGQRRGELACGHAELTAWAYLSYLNGVVLIMDIADVNTWEHLGRNGVWIFRPLRS